MWDQQGKGKGTVSQESGNSVYSGRATRAGMACRQSWKHGEGRASEEPGRRLDLRLGAGGGGGGDSVPSVTLEGLGLHGGGCLVVWEPGSWDPVTIRLLSGHMTLSTS